MYLPLNRVARPVTPAANESNKNRSQIYRRLVAASETLPERIVKLDPGRVKLLRRAMIFNALSPRRERRPRGFPVHSTDGCVVNGPGRPTEVRNLSAERSLLGHLGGATVKRSRRTSCAGAPDAGGNAASRSVRRHENASRVQARFRHGTRSQLIFPPVAGRIAGWIFLGEPCTEPFLKIRAFRLQIGPRSGDFLQPFAEAIDDRLGECGLPWLLCVAQMVVLLIQPVHQFAVSPCTVQIGNQLGQMRANAEQPHGGSFGKDV